jgi:hypothetical protein
MYFQEVLENKKQKCNYFENSIKNEILNFIFISLFVLFLYLHVHIFKFFFLVFAIAIA